MSDKRFYTVRQFAELAGVSRQTVYRHLDGVGLGFQSHMGHSSADTTWRYVSLDTASLREAIEKVGEANKSIL